jgi:hypothetical protein
MPHIPVILPAEEPLAAKLLNDLTQVAAAAIMTGQTDDTLHIRLAEHTHKLLSTGRTHLLYKTERSGCGLFEDTIPVAS